ncbi:response regulator transcription factor [Paenibacillus thalictri]|uniref:Response regulator n=1 Tax=Paenibacillus thalictri TaxID=2527873 RepID=A0A4Q9DKK3_9BACL|nr:response regulator [Paenibacillus thalictri]TBL75313.1 response regulator [Paenibacillus thalictri]
MFHVLVAEDEPLVRSAVIEMVENSSCGFKVVAETGNGEDAWNLIQELWPTIVITDIVMPKGDGLWLLRQIDEQKLPIVTIIISGHDDFDYAKQAIRHGVSEYLLKPILEEELLDALRRSLNRLHALRDTHAYLVRMQEFFIEIDKLDQQQMIREIMAIVNSLLQMKSAPKGVRTSLLSVFSNKLIELLQGIDPGYQPPAKSESDEAIRSYFLLLVEAWGRISAAASSQDVKSIIKKACDHIKQNYMKNLTVTGMAEYCSLSTSYFRHLFKLHTGHSFVHYLNILRIEKAKELLWEYDIKVYEVSEMVGYVSLPYFNRVFKSVVGESPNEYRKKMGL